VLHLGGGLGLALECARGYAERSAALARCGDTIVLTATTAVEQRIARLVDHAHRALAERLEDLVAADRLAASPRLVTTMPGGATKRMRVTVRGRSDDDGGAE
jgi:hypothetical protein